MITMKFVNARSPCQHARAIASPFKEFEDVPEVVSAAVALFAMSQPLSFLVVVRTSAAVIC